MGSAFFLAFGIVQLTIPSTLHQSVVTVKIEIDKHPFVIHRERLCHYSSYFRTHFTGNEAGRHTMEIPDQDREIFKIVEHWLYNQKLHQADTGDGDLELSDMIRVYVFAFKFGMPLLQNAIVDSVLAIRGILAEPQDVQYLCKNTPPKAPLQRLLVTMFALDAKPLWFESRMDDLPKGFISRIALLNISRLARRLPDNPSPFETDICQYHEHNNTTETVQQSATDHRRGSVIVLTSGHSRLV